MTLENPIRAIPRSATTSPARRRWRLANGREATALDIQWEYFTGRALAEQKGLSPSRERSDVGALSHRPREGSRCRQWECDWVINTTSRAYRDKNDLALTHPKIALMAPVPRRQPRPRALLQDAGPRHLSTRVVTDEAIDRPDPVVSSRRRRRGRGCAASSFGRPRRRSATTRRLVHLKLNDQAQRPSLQGPVQGEGRASRPPDRSLCVPAAMAPRARRIVALTLAVVVARCACRHRRARAPTSPASLRPRHVEGRRFHGVGHIVDGWHGRVGEGAEGICRKAPKAIKGDLKTIARPSPSRQALQGHQFDPASGKTPTAAQMAKLQRATTLLGSKKFAAASERVNAWSRRHCGTAP